MAQHLDTLIKNGLVVTAGGIVSVNIGIANGKIQTLDASLHTADQVIDAKGLHVLPGIIDSQVHFREPGMTHKEDIESGTKAAVLGGITAIMEMPNTKPPTTHPDAITEKLNLAAQKAWCHYAFFGGASPDNLDQIEALEAMEGCAGIKIFMGSSTGSLLLDDTNLLRAVLSKTKRRVAVHAEDEATLKARYHLAEESGDPAIHPIWRNEESALKATTNLIEAVRATKSKAHVLHITTAEEMALLSAHKDLISVEVTPQHLYFNSNDYARLGTRLQMNPPIRHAEHQKALWLALRSGLVDVVASDHAPHLLSEKVLPYPQSPSGMPGVQTLLSVMLHFVDRGQLSLLRLVDLLSAAPAKLYQIKGKGRIAVGYDADFTLVDLNKSWVVDDNLMASKCGWTPYHGETLSGKVIQTIIAGQISMMEGTLTERPAVAPLSFL